jgi:hypothetical protein
VAIASCSTYSGYTAAQPARLRGKSPALAMLALAAAVFAPASAQGDIYKWVDEQGITVISDRAPADPAKVSGMRLLSKAPQSAARVPVSAPDPAPSAKEQELEARIEDLERQLQEQQSTPPPAPQVSDDGGYYPAPPAPEPDSYGGYASGYSAVYYPVPYYAAPPVYSVIVVPARPAVHRRTPARRPAFAPQPRFVSRPQFTGPPPQFAGPTPRFTGPTPRFTGPAPQFVSQQGSANSARNAFTLRPIQRGGLIRAQR